MSRQNNSGCICFILFIPLSFCVGIETIDGKAKIPAFFTFGDSIVDPGNNNFISTFAKANHPPYGQEFIGDEENGRFCDGKLATDFIASGLGVKEKIPPFLDPNLDSQELLTGVSFASAGSGFDDLTAAFFRRSTALLQNAIPMWKQAELFQKYKASVENMVGKENSSNIIGEAIFLVIAGTNDFLVNYLFLPTRRYQFSVQQYQEFVLQICSNFIEELYKLGVRKLGMGGVPPLGCMPVEKTLYGQSKLHGCIEKCNEIASSYNQKLKQTLQGLQTRLPGIRVEYVDIYDRLLDMVKNPSLYGFEKSHIGCCGTGVIEMGPLCNVETPITCPNTSNSVFWDAAHPTQGAYQIIADDVLRQYISKLL